MRNERPDYERAVRSQRIEEKEEMQMFLSLSFPIPSLDLYIPF